VCIWLQTILGRSDGRNPRGNYLAISAHLSVEERRLHYHDEVARQRCRKIFLIIIFCQIPSVSSKELALPRLACCELSRLRCHGHSLLWSSYLCRIKRKNSSCSAGGHQLQDLTHLLLDYPASEPLRCAIFGTTSTIFDLWSKPWGVARLWAPQNCFKSPSYSKGSRSTSTICIWFLITVNGEF